MKRKYFTYAVIPALALMFAGAGIASAHGWFGGFMNASPAEVAQRHETMFQHGAELLGISVADFKTAWSQGKTLPEIAAGKGLSTVDLEIKLKTAKETRLKEHLQALVSQGIITQAQADARFETIKTRVADRKMRHKMGWGL